MFDQQYLSNNFSPVYSQLDSVETTEQLRRTVSQEEFEFLTDCGYSKPLHSCVLDDKEEMLERVILHFTQYRIRAGWTS